MSLGISFGKRKDVAVGEVSAFGEGRPKVTFNCPGCQKEVTLPIKNGKIRCPMCDYSANVEYYGPESEK
jgi:ribosomal protein L37AE/L43A